MENDSLLETNVAGIHGRLGEDLAVQALRAHGFGIIERNWRCRVGEVDIVARDGETLVFVEVKLRQQNSFVSPEEAVSARKGQRLLQTALLYLTENELHDVAWRLDVIAIELDKHKKVERLDVYQDAIRADD